jgi:hypothetical protein
MDVPMNTKETDWPYITAKFDDTSFTIMFNNEETKENWDKTYLWDSIRKVCFKSYDYGAPHFCYLYFKDNSDEIIIPVESQDGVVEFWEELKEKGLFDRSMEKYAQYSSQPEFNCHEIE